MPTGAQKAVRQQIDLHERIRAAREHGEIAVVTAVSATGGTDGQPLVTVTHNGGSYQYPHLATYAPTSSSVGDVVAVHPWSGTYLILGKPVGFPPTT